MIVRVEELPVELKEDETGVIVLGEKTGHKHRIVKGKLLRNRNGTSYLDVKKEAQVVHEEHRAIKLKRGKYVILRQREYTNKDAVRLVTD
jgi:hypothetical protein